MDFFLDSRQILGILPSVHTLHHISCQSFGHPACFVLSFSSHSDILHKNPSFDSCFFTYFVYFYQSNRFHTLSTRFLPHFHRASASSVSPWAFCLGPRDKIDASCLPEKNQSQQVVACLLGGDTWNVLVIVNLHNSWQLQKKIMTELLN